MSSLTSSEKPIREKAFTFKKRVAVPVVEVPSSGDDDDDDFKPSRHRRRQLVSAKSDDDSKSLNVEKKISGKLEDKVNGKIDKKTVSKVKKRTIASKSTGTGTTTSAIKTNANADLREFQKAESNDNSEALALVNLRSVTPELGTSPSKKVFETDDIEFVCTIASASTSSSTFSGSIDREDGKGKEAWKNLMSKMQTNQTSSKISKKGKSNAKRGLTKNSNGMMTSISNDL